MLVTLQYELNQPNMVVGVDVGYVNGGNPAQQTEGSGGQYHTQN